MHTRNHGLGATVSDGVGLGSEVPVGDAALVAVEVDVGVKVGGTGVAVGVTVLVGVRNGVKVSEGVKVKVGVSVIVTVPVGGTGVSVGGFGVPVCVGVAVLVGV